MEKNQKKGCQSQGNIAMFQWFKISCFEKQGQSAWLYKAAFLDGAFSQSYSSFANLCVLLWHLSKFLQLFWQAHALVSPSLHFCTQDECSYVSLRDVVRAMIVFEWFLEKLSSLQELKELLHQKERQADVKVAIITLSSATYNFWLCTADVNWYGWG